MHGRGADGILRQPLAYPWPRAQILGVAVSLYGGGHSCAHCSHGDDRRQEHYTVDSNTRVTQVSTHRLRLVEARHPYPRTARILPVSQLLRRAGWCCTRPSEMMIVGFCSVEGLVRTDVLGRGLGRGVEPQDRCTILDPQVWSAPENKVGPVWLREREEPRPGNASATSSVTAMAEAPTPYSTPPTACCETLLRTSPGHAWTSASSSSAERPRSPRARPC